MTEDILQIPAIDTQAWPNDMVVGYLTGWMRRYAEAFDADHPAPGKVPNYMTDALTLIQTLLNDYKEFTVAPQTEEIHRADDERDVRVEQVQTMIYSMDKMVGLPAMQQAAHTLRAGWDNYKPTAKAALRDESTQIQQWLEYVAANADQQQALQTLGLTQIVQELEQYNNQVIQLMDERAAERQQRKAVVISDERRAADRAAKNCDRMVNAYALIDANEHRYDTLITNLTADQTEWRQRYEAHQRTAKRVSVKSTVVGRSTFGRLLPKGRKNHLYSTARGWTWAQLIDDGKALLAIDPKGGTVIATGGEAAAAIGSSWQSTCGTITITDGITSVTATKEGTYTTDFIGVGDSNSTCGTVSIADGLTDATDGNTRTITKR